MRISAASDRPNVRIEGPEAGRRLARASDGSEQERKSICRDAKPKREDEVNGGLGQQIDAVGDSNHHWKRSDCRDGNRQADGVTEAFEEVQVQAELRR